MKESTSHGHDLTCAYSVVVSDVVVKADFIVATQSIRVARWSRTVAFGALSVRWSGWPLADRLLVGWLLSNLFNNWRFYWCRRSLLHVQTLAGLNGWQLLLLLLLLSRSLRLLRRLVNSNLHATWGLRDRTLSVLSSSRAFLSGN